MLYLTKGTAAHMQRRESRWHREHRSSLTVMKLSGTGVLFFPSA